MGFTGTPTVRLSATKRFFECDEGGAQWYIVALTLEDAQRMLRELGVEFGPEPVPFEQATLTWRELDAAEVAKRTRCDRGDGIVIPLEEANIGDMFCTEF